MTAIKASLIITLPEVGEGTAVHSVQIRKRSRQGPGWHPTASTWRTWDQIPTPPPPTPGSWASTG